MGIVKEPATSDGWIYKTKPGICQKVDEGQSEDLELSEFVLFTKMAVKMGEGHKRDPTWGKLGI